MSELRMLNADPENQVYISHLLRKRSPQSLQKQFSNLLLRVVREVIKPVVYRFSDNLNVEEFQAQIRCKVSPGFKKVRIFD